MRDFSDVYFEANSILSTTSDFDSALVQICVVSTELLDTNFVEIVEWNQHQKSLATKARFRRTIWDQAIARPFDIFAYPLLNQLQAFKSHKPIAIDLQNVEKGTLFEGISAAWLIPVWLENKLIGAIVVGYPTKEKLVIDDDVIEIIVYHAECIILNTINEANARKSLRTIADVLQISGCEVVRLGNDQQFYSVASIEKYYWSSDNAPHFDLQELSDIVFQLQSQPKVSVSNQQSTTAEVWQSFLDSRRLEQFTGMPIIYQSNFMGLMIVGDAESNLQQSTIAQIITTQLALYWHNHSLQHKLEKNEGQLKSTQDRLIQTARITSIAELAGVVAHQINNPLTTIIADTQLLLETSDDLAQRQSLEAILRAGQRAAGVAHKLLSLSRSHASDSEVSNIDIVRSLSAIVSLMRTYIEQDHIHVTLTVPSDTILPVSAFKDNLDDVWLNILFNAQDALVGRENRKIAIKVAKNGSFADVTIADNGIGIPVAIQPQIFDAFFTTKEDGERLGLGLHIAKQIIEQHHGIIEVESQVGLGTQFLIRLPLLMT